MATAIRKQLSLAICAAMLASVVGAPASSAWPTSPSARSAASDAQTSGLQAFVLVSSPDSFADLRAHVGALDAVYPTYFECAIPSGAIVGAANPEIDAYAGRHHLAELPRYTCQVGAIVHRILTEPSLRERTLAKLVALAASPSYAGLNLDLENDGPGDREVFSLFVQALARGLHAEHRRLAVDVVGVTSEPTPRPEAIPRPETPRPEAMLRPWEGFYDYRAISANADTVFVMAWGTHWEHSGPGPIAPLSYVRGVAKFVASLPYASRFVLGAPMYGLDWPVTSGRAGASTSRGTTRQRPEMPQRPEGPQRASALQYAEVVALARSVGAAPVRDSSSGEMTFAYTRAGVAHRVWYMDAQAIDDCLRVAREYGLGAGVWRLGSEDQALWGQGV